MPHSVPSPDRSTSATALVALVLGFLLALGLPAPPRAHAAGSSDGPHPDVVAAGLMPSPSPDPWYRLGDPDADLSPGTVLDTRPVTFPLTNIWVPHRAWQLRVRSTDAVGRPMSIVTTVVVPTAPVPGGGPRPVVSLDMPIDSLGLQCNPSWALVHEIHPDVPPVPNEMLRRGWALVITDHQGPRMAYAAGPLAGHAVLDGLRAARSFAPAGLGGSPVVLNGYSGGAIASGWAAQLQPAYAPELTGALVGVVAGGTPSDPDLLFDTMDGQIGSGLFRSAIIGISRAYDELHPLYNHYGVALAAGPLRDLCAKQGEATGLVQAPIGWLAVTPELRADPVVRRVIAANRMGGAAPSAPVLLFHGSASVGLGDQFIPEHGVLRLRDEWCALGAHVEYLPVFGEHMIAPLSAREPTFAWMADRFAGVPLGAGCVGARPV